MESAFVGELNPLVDYRYSYSPKEYRTLSSADTIAKLREKVAPLRFNLAARSISRELQLQGGEKILEVGSGLGLLGKAIKEEVDGDLNYFGIEIAFNPASDSKEKTIDPVQANAVKLPFADSSFDAIVTTDVFEHISDAEGAVEEVKRVLKPGGKAFVVIADPSEARFSKVPDHINRMGQGSDIKYWEELFDKKGLNILSKNSEKYRNLDWRKVFNLPFLSKFKEKPGFACAFNPVNRPGVYILQKDMGIK